MTIAVLTLLPAPAIALAAGVVVDAR